MNQVNYRDNNICWTIEFDYLLYTTIIFIQSEIPIQENKTNTRIMYSDDNQQVTDAVIDTIPAVAAALPHVASSEDNSIASSSTVSTAAEVEEAKPAQARSTDDVAKPSSLLLIASESESNNGETDDCNKSTSMEDAVVVEVKNAKIVDAAADLVDGDGDDERNIEQVGINTHAKNDELKQFIFAKYYSH